MKKFSRDEHIYRRELMTVLFRFQQNQSYLDWNSFAWKDSRIEMMHVGESSNGLHCEGESNACAAKSCLN